METIAKHNIVVMAILTQAEAQKQQGLKAKNDSAPAVMNGRIGRREGRETASSEAEDAKDVAGAGSSPSDWQISWDYSLHKNFPMIKLKK